MESQNDEKALPTVHVSNIPQSATAKELLQFLESIFGPSSVFALEIRSHHENWNSRGSGRVQFETLESKSKAITLSLQNDLVFMSHYLQVTESYGDIVPRPCIPRNRVRNSVLYAGFMVRDDRMSVVESWEGVKGWVMPERKRVEFWVPHGGNFYKLEIMFDHILEAHGYSFGGDSKINAIVFKLKYGPKIYQKTVGPNIAAKFKADRYHFCKEDFEFLWVRTTDFSATKSIGHSTSFCWEIEEELFASDIFKSFPRYRENLKGLILEDGEEFCSSTETVPLVKCGSDSKLPYEILFQLNSLVHTQKLSLASVDDDLIDLLGSLDEETKAIILEKMHKLDSTCYEPLKFVRTQLHVLSSRGRRPPPSSRKRLTDNNIMSCHRALITPLKIYCLGPELETSNHVVKHFAEYASDFMRVTFVEEDWTKLQPDAVSCRAQKGISVSSRVQKGISVSRCVQKGISVSSCVQKGIFPKPFRTEIYKRILTILRDGIVIGSKKFEFLAFSASQLRSSSVWLFASNDNVKAEDIREWMGCFNNIRSVSKCAARMGQLFSSSVQTLEVPAQDVEIIPDIEVTTDGVNYCFSDGIGKISQSFARQVAQKLKLDQSRIPSAFQIRYGGYKGVIAVDRHSYRKLSLRSSMLKFESNNRMLCVTKWSESMPCFLNREIISLLSTLGVKDEVFLAMQQEQLNLLGRMLTDSEAALDVLVSLSGADSKSILVKMLRAYYEPNSEPYLSMMLMAQYAYQLSDLKSKCRIVVPKGRILVGCLDETGILNYGQVFVRITVKKTKEQFEDESLRKADGDDCTSIIVGKVVVTKNPCLHPGDVRVLDAIYSEELEEKGLRDCLVFPQKGHRPHPNECSGGDLDGDLFFISWDKELIPCEIVAPMDYTGRRPRVMDHKVTLEEIHQFFVDYMINDTLGAISTAHLVHADREPNKARSRKCLELANLHSMAVDFAKTGAPAEMPRVLKPKEFPDFMERDEKPKYISNGVLGKLYRAIIDSNLQARSSFVWSEKIAEEAYDQDLEVRGFEVFLETALSHKEMYAQKMSNLMNFYSAETEDEMLTGNLQNRATYLQRDNRRYGDMKDRILIAVKNLQREAKEWFETSCQQPEYQHLASAWYHVTYHPRYFQESSSFLSFPWIVGDILLNIKSANSKAQCDNLL
ncbi:PREDICTED: RNA-dependent RNA polymerase 2 isoform X2 [Lupinus angustifolius]|uniref:RNA-dependent RNA polymerase 2 isoform X1 n=1 Tax=Lupinus angustifolius TaxID=3871 RepID=UPI00092F50E0|nr:PREDICTED: RNA-dependent RNA polymerase 2 isoform X1 [Lupinus angustifolius]XP_019456863.1 PREDICTED: RNA-dependent RNA polymerase 2 isoform X1 [Lupinus angustifolius]XP_019456871.1 PREDICTED: RNA-dependent RNA polymerase 2 isoform X2 [Lupinus angustifolius]